MTRAGIRVAGNAAGIPAEQWDGSFLRACRGLTNPRPPIWLMRQAGRYQSWYRELRDQHGFLALCREPALSAEVTDRAARQLGTDAAIIFADILLILQGFGLNLEFIAGEGPVLTPAVRSSAAIDRLADPAQAAADTACVAAACREARARLPASVPLIGFCGGPFTLASYAIEGGPSRQFAATRCLMYREPAAWHRLCERLVAALGPYLRDQIAAGCAAVQIFESWVGELTVVDFAEFVAPHLRRLIAGLPNGIPVIVFGVHTSHLLKSLAACGPDVVGIDHCTDLVAAWDGLGGPNAVAVQGNLDPGLLLGDEARLLAAADRLLAAVGDRPGFIANLGHGVLKETPVERAIALCRHLHGA